jgi:hypothetical protein
MRASIGQMLPNANVIVSQSAALGQSKSGFLDDKEATNVEAGNVNGHRRGVSETEYLLNQIRNNINTLKAYQPYQAPNVGPIIENQPQDIF